MDYNNMDYKNPQFRFPNHEAFIFNDSFRFDDNNLKHHFGCVTSHLSLHGELSWMRDWMPMVGGAIRYKNPTLTFAGQVSTTSAVLNLVFKGSEKSSYVADLTCNFTSRGSIPRVGYVRSVKRGRWFAHFDWINRVIVAQLEERWIEGVHFILSTEVDVEERQWKLGFGMTIS